MGGHKAIVGEENIYMGYDDDKVSDDDDDLG